MLRRPASASPSPRLISAALALALAAGLGLVVPARAAAPEAKGLTVSVVRPHDQELAETLLVTGSLLPREELQVGPEIEGYRVTEILAEVGDKVTKGQVLARLSRDVLETQLAQNTANAAKAKAAIAQQKASLDQALAQEVEANSAVERTRQLRKTGTATQETLDERERAVKVTAAQVAAARESLHAAEADAVLVQAQRAELELKLERTEVRAPDAGIILARDARIGAIALSARTEPLFRIARDGAIDLDAEIPEVALPRVAVGQSVAVTPAGFAKPVDGNVRLISAEVDKASRLGRAKIALPFDPALRPGSFARGLILLDHRRGLSVPQAAVMFDGEGAYVLVVKDGVIAERRVKTGLKAEGSVELLSGVGADDLVVARAAGFLRDGDRVTPVETAKTVSEAR
ncbi:efflux RND transporter periplasmic adaptor subunit [Azorhizobium doebereinerae]|uniref:efflux RND transporter periplasmic adaptor subunit n=1 Tax=Azorhizobium doebereinerae TaxID=281091 RepID=UPI0006859BE0|nr:efflux RND transporter periplasmic adaptor subunit [Azorhizobium doebereinerae]